MPGNNINLGYTLTVPENVEHCFQALSLDERRYLFPLTRLVQDKYTDSNILDINEVFFMGFHSDVGGGNRNLALSSIPLVWMLKRAKDYGIHVPNERIDKQKNLRNPAAACKKPRMDQIPYKNAPFSTMMQCTIPCPAVNGRMSHYLKPTIRPRSCG